MSGAADQALGRRQASARPAGRRDLRVRLLRWLLPVGILLVMAALMISPLLNTREQSFVLKKDQVARAPERLRVERARYSGVDDGGRRFELIAGGAVQQSSAEPVVQLSDLRADLQTADGDAKLRAPVGRYDMDSAALGIPGPLVFEGPGGYRLATSNVTVSLRGKQVTSAGRVTGEMPLGRFSADRLSADLDSRAVVLSGQASLHIDQGKAKAR